VEATAVRLAVDPDTKPGNPTGANQYKREETGTVPNSSQVQRAEENGVGVRTQRMLDRLARDRPDLLEEVQAGRMKTKTAAREAGIVRVPTAYELAQKVIRKLTAEERGNLVRWMDEGMP
jgi:hypothetical protein